MAILLQTTDNSKRKKTFTSLAFALAMLFIGTMAEAKSKFLGYIPNGETVSCGACHALPKYSLVQFGKDFKSNGKTWTVALANLDSDGDGFSNGEELQDPNGQWTQGNANPGDMALVTSPSDPSDFPAPPVPTSTPTVPPQPTATPTQPEIPQPTATPTQPIPTPEPNNNATVIDFNEQTDDFLIAATNGFAMPIYSFVDFPDEIGSPASGDGHGLKISVNNGHGLTLYGPAVETSGRALVQCYVYVSSPNVEIALAALNVPNGGALSETDGSLTVNMPSSSEDYAGHWGVLEVIYDPLGGALVPIFQAIAQKGGLEEVYVDRIIVTPLKNLAPEILAQLLSTQSNDETPNGGTNIGGGGSGGSDDEDMEEDGSDGEDEPDDYDSDDGESDDEDD